MAHPGAQQNWHKLRTMSRAVQGFMGSQEQDDPGSTRAGGIEKNQPRPTNPDHIPIPPSRTATAPVGSNWQQGQSNPYLQPSVPGQFPQPAMNRNPVENPFTPGHGSSPQGFHQPTTSAPPQAGYPAQYPASGNYSQSVWQPGQFSPQPDLVAQERYMPQRMQTSPPFQQHPQGSGYGAPGTYSQPREASREYQSPPRNDSFGGGQYQSPPQSPPYGSGYSPPQTQNPPYVDPNNTSQFDPNYRIASDSFTREPEAHGTQPNGPVIWCVSCKEWRQLQGNRCATCSWKAQPS